MTKLAYKLLNGIRIGANTLENRSRSMSFHEFAVFQFSNYPKDWGKYHFGRHTEIWPDPSLLLIFLAIFLIILPKGIIIIGQERDAPTFYV